MRVFARFKKNGSALPAKISEWLELEKAAGLLDQAAYQIYKESVESIRDELMDILATLKNQGKKIAAYGASAKGNTVLNYYGIGLELLSFIADKNTLKHGLYSPGMHIPVMSTEMINTNKPDYLLILAWNLADEIMEQQKEFKVAGGKFIIPIPKPVIV